MKKRLFVAVVIGALALAILIPTAFAAVDGNQGNGEWFNGMFDAHKKWVGQSVKNGQITPEQGKAWEQHFDQMKEFHAQNGYNCPGFGGGMMGGMMNGSGNGGMMGGGYGPGMTGNFNGNNSGNTI